MSTRAALPDSEPGAGGISHFPLLARLTGRSLPAVSLPSTMGSPVELGDVQRAVLYVYPGAPWVPGDGYDSRVLDEAQHQAFANRWHDLLALNCNAFGVSSQPADEQSAIASALGIGHPLLSDRDQYLARELGLPRFGVDAVSWYCRLTLVINDGVIARAFYPVASATRSSVEAIEWMRQRWI